MTYGGTPCFNNCSAIILFSHLARMSPQRRLETKKETATHQVQKRWEFRFAGIIKFLYYILPIGGIFVAWHSCAFYGYGH